MMDEQTKAAFSYATEVVKHLLTLATGVVALSITFTKDLNSKPTNAQVWLLEASWALLLVSIVFGLLTLMALTGTIAKTSPIAANAIYGNNVRFPMSAQLLFFVIGMGLTILYGWSAV